MDMHAPDHYPLKWPLVAHHHIYQQANAKKCYQERDGGKEHASPWPVWNCRTNQVSQARQLQQYQEQHHDKAGKNK